MARVVLWAILLFLSFEATRSEKSVQEWMSILYPVMTATSFMVTIVMLLYYIRVRPVRLVLVTSFFMVAETVVLALLTLTTGTHPVLNIDQYRPLVAWARFFQWIAMLWIVHDAARMILRDENHRALLDKFVQKGKNYENQSCGFLGGASADDGSSTGGISD